MRFSQFSKLITLAAAMLLAASAFAGSSVHKGSIALGDAVQINGKQIPAGEYMLAWEGDGPNVNVRFLREGKEVASTPATVTQLDEKASQNAAELKGAGETRELIAVRFSGKKYQLDISSAASEAKANSGNSVNK
jgi:hypothetical protein